MNNCERCRKTTEDCRCTVPQYNAYIRNYNEALARLDREQEKHTEAILLLRRHGLDCAADTLADSVSSIKASVHPAFAYDAARQADPELRK